MLNNILKSFIKIAKNNALPEEQEQFTHKVLLVSEALMLVGNTIYLILSIIKQERFFVGVFACVYLPYLAATILTICKKKKPASIILIFTYIVLFTLTFIARIDCGIWALFLPALAMYIMGYIYGLFLGFLFFVVNFCLCCIPFFRSIMLNNYESIYLFRYFIIYSFSFVISASVMFDSHRTMVRQKEASDELRRKQKEEHDKVNKYIMQTILSISNAVEKKDSYTSEHSKRVAYFSSLIAKELGWNKEKIDNLKILAKLHDIGKIGIHDDILNNKEKYKPEEYEEMKKHALIGYNIVKDLNIIPGLELGVKYHHERIDKTGYPDQIGGDEIPIEAKIISIADSYDAMAYDRVYRNRISSKRIRSELIKGKGKQFDADLVSLFIDICENNNWFSEGVVFDE